jgi:hypothetical protein
VRKLLDEHCFLILNTYSLGFSSLIIENLLNDVKGLNTGELYLPHAPATNYLLEYSEGSAEAVEPPIPIFFSL